MNYVVYKHTNKINGKVYIGQTCQKPEYRWGSKGQNYKSGYFKNAIQKYGWDNFEHTILYSNLTAEEANQIEQKLILQYQSYKKEYGYNSDLGGKNKTPTQETREKQSLAALNRPPVSIETKEKLSAKGKGLIRTATTKEKMSKAAKIREQNKNGRKNLPIICINTNQYFKSIREAANWCGLVGTSGICSVCKKGKQKTAGVHPVTKEKLQWRYATDLEIIKYENSKNNK